MGKSSSVPAYSTGSININGKNVATTKKSGNGIEGSYNMSDIEKSIYDGVQKNLSSSLEKLFTISDEKQKQFNSELEAYKQNGIKEINKIYDPMVTELTNNIAGRFGNLDNSIFMDKLSNITENKAEAVADLSNSLLEKQSELYFKEISNQLNYVTLLNSLNNSMNSNILNYVSAALSNSASGNNYNQFAYANSGSWLDSASQLTNMATKVMSAWPVK